MVANCSIRYCKSTAAKGSMVKFFSFPKDKTVVKEWLRYCKPKTSIKHARVCSHHFTPSDYNKTLQHILLNEEPKRLKPDAVPTLQIDNVDIRSIPPDDLEKTCELLGTRGSSLEDLRCFTGSPTVTPAAYENGSSAQVVKNSQYQSKAAFTIKVEGDINYEVPVIEGSSNILEKSQDQTNLPIKVEVKGSIDVKEELADDEDFDDSFRKVSITLAEYKSLKRKAKEYDILKKKVNEYDILKHNLEQSFTPGQIRCFLKPNKERVKWTKEDIVKANLLRRKSPKAYHILKATLGIPLPSPSTLRQWDTRKKIKQED